VFEITSRIPATSFPRRRETSFSTLLVSRLRGNGENRRSYRNREVISDTMPSRQIRRPVPVLLANYIVDQPGDTGGSLEIIGSDRPANEKSPGFNKLKPGPLFSRNSDYEEVEGETPAGEVSRSHLS
jgi:hypothetical protein